MGCSPKKRSILIGAAICDALTYLDSRNPPIVHRDIKPGNVKITPQGQIFLVDFGLAKIVQGDQATTTGARAMTPGYSPPEQYGTARTDHRSDIFSLGATLYAALTGAIPEDALARAMEQINLTPIRKRNPKISRRLAAVIEKSLEVRPDDRYQSAEEFKQALLSVRGITSRRRQGEFALAPDSERASTPNGTNGALVLAADPASPGVRPGVQPEVRSPAPLPSSFVISPAPSSRPRPRPCQALGLDGPGSAGIYPHPGWPDLIYLLPHLACSGTLGILPQTSHGCRGCCCPSHRYACATGLASGSLTHFLNAHLTPYRRLCRPLPPALQLPLCPQSCSPPHSRRLLPWGAAPVRSPLPQTAPEQPRSG